MKKSLTILGGLILITQLAACKAANTTQGTAADQQLAQNPAPAQTAAENTAQQFQPSADPSPSSQASQDTAPSSSYATQGSDNQGYYPQAAPYSTAQIEQMVAPIALYPDALMTQVLMAAAYPYDVTDADQWVQSNRDLTGANLDNALATSSWDPSVIALCKFPTALDRMAQDIQWTTDLGTAFVNQRSDVMSAIQRLRQDAYRSGHLRTSTQQRVVVDAQYIVIQPYTPDMYYVPYYNPMIVYGAAWNYPNYYYPGVWTPSPYYSPGYAFVNGFAWGVGVSFGNVLFGGYDWNRQDVYVNNNVFYGNAIYRNTDYYRNRSMYGGQAHGNWAYNARYNSPQEGFVRAPYAGQAHGNIRGLPQGALRGGNHRAYLEKTYRQGSGGGRAPQGGARAGQLQHENQLQQQNQVKRQEQLQRQGQAQRQEQIQRQGQHPGGQGQAQRQGMKQGHGQGGGKDHPADKPNEKNR